MQKLNLKSMLFLIATFILLPIYANAQEEMSTLFGGDKDIRYGGYGAFETKFSQLDDGFGGILVGGRGGIILNNVFSFGGAGYGLLPTKKIECTITGHKEEKNNYWTGGYGGFFFEYINSSNKLVHFTINALIGWGGITYVSHSNNWNDWSSDNKKHPVSVTWIFEPGIGLELNVAKIFRMYLGASYRYAPNFEFLNDIGNEIVPRTAFNGIAVNLAFKFGNFKGHTTKEITDGIKNAFTDSEE